MAIDLHTHSVYSDGSDKPEEIIEKAAAQGLRAVALTDHDTTDKYVFGGQIFDGIASFSSYEHNYPGLVVDNVQ